MIYIFDKTQAIIKVLTNDDFTAAHLNFKINMATTFEFSLPASKSLPSGSKYVATPHPLYDSKFIMLRLTERVDNTETIDYSAYELAYQELATDGYIEDKRPQNQSALNLMKIALDGSNWELNNVNVSGAATTNFYYVDRLSAISKVVDLLGGEIVFYIEIQGNAISGRYMDYLARQGADTSKVFASGSNLLTVERQSDTSNIYTAILPRGKGEEIDNGDADTPDGYGRRINIADVEWKKSAGKPLDKPKGSIVLSDPDATAEWGQINGNARLLLQTYDDIDDVNVLINSAYKTLQSVNHPQIQYSATVADVGGLSLGDTVLIMHGDRDLSYKTRVFEVKYDLLSPDQTELSLGDDLSSNSITSQINNVNAVADTTSSQTQWTINQVGRPSTAFGNTEPANPKVGDVFFKELPDGGTEIYRWNGNIWELLASPTTADDIATAVDDAVTQAKEHVDEVKQGLSSDIATAKSQATSLASTAEANAKSEATSLFSRAQNALSDAKTDLTKSISSEASKAVATANSQAQNYVNEAKKDITDTINAISAGDRNYILDTANPKTQTSNGKDNQDLYNQANFYKSLDQWAKTDTQYKISFDWNLKTVLTNDMMLTLIINQAPWQSFTVTIPANKLSGHVDITFILWNSMISAKPTGLNFRINSQMSSGNTITYSNLFMKSGTITTDWTPAPEDVVLDYTTKDNKIKETISQYQETNDGKVRKAQTDATTALGLVETKISQTDYDKKTGELSKKVNEAKDTADGAVSAVGDYKTSNDKRVEAAESKIEQSAKDITAKVSQTDYDKKTGNLTEAISKVKITADGINNFVRDSSGNISSDFQTALSKTSIITGSPFATSIQEQTATRITSALTDNNKNIISLINLDTTGAQIYGKNIVLDGNTTVTGDFYAKGGNFKNLNASNLTVGTLNGNQVNITNVNAANITGDITKFIQSNWNGVYGSTTITSSGMTIVSPGTVALFNVNGMTLDGAGGMTKVANGFTQIYSATHENVGMIGHQKDVDHDNVDYLMFGLNGYRTTNDGDSHWVGGSDFYGGDGMGFGVSNKKGTYDLKLRWDSKLIAGYKGELQGWHASDQFIFDNKTFHKGYADFSGGVTMSGAYPEGTRYLHTQGMSISTGAKWFGFMDGSNSTGFGTDQTQDVLFYVKGQVYSLYTMLGKLGMR